MTAPHLKPPRAILFDWDNTLVNVWPTIHEALNAALTAMGHAPWTLAETLQRVRRSLRDSFPAMFGERWTEAREIFYATYNRRHLDMLQPLPGARELLGRLSAQRMLLGVVSNKTGSILRLEAAHLGWSRYFASIVGAGDAASDKPAPDPIYLVLKESGYLVDKSIWYVGDTAMDMECARRAGCTAILVGEPAGEAEALAMHKPEGRVPQLEKLMDLAVGAGLSI
jgi:phosphoglycolate phosphatase